MIKTNPILEKKRQTIERRIVKAIENDESTFKLIRECEMLFKEEYINANDFNFLTDIENLKQIYA